MSAVAYIPLFDLKKSIELPPITKVHCKAIALDLDDTITNTAWLNKVLTCRGEALKITKPGFIKFINDTVFLHKQNVYIVTNNQRHIVTAYLSLLFGSEYTALIQGVICSDGCLGFESRHLSRSISTEIEKLSYGSKERALSLLAKITELPPNQILYLDNDGKHYNTANSQNYIVLQPQYCAKETIFLELHTLRKKPMLMTTRV